MHLRNKVTILLSTILIMISGCKDDDAITTNPTISKNNITGDIDFVKNYGGTKNESAQSVTKTLDGGYAILGFTQSMDGDITDKQNESFDFWVLKFNSEDQLQWNKTYGGTADDSGKEIIQTQDGGYAILGSTFSADGDVTTNNGSEDYWIAKLNASGTLLWQKSFGFSGSDFGTSLLQSNDNGYLITGVLDVTQSGGAGNTKNNGSQNRHAGGDYWAIKLDASGNLEWSKYFGGNLSDTPRGVVQTEDNGFIIAGASDSDDTDISNNIGSDDFWVIKIDADGLLVWEKNFGGAEIDEARAIVKSNDGNYIIAGDTRSIDGDISSGMDGADLWLIKISPLGELLWEKTIGGNSFDVARDIKSSQDGGFILSGASRSSDGDLTTNHGQNDAWIVKVNSTGNVQWSKTVGGTNIDFAYGVAELEDKTVVAVGDTSSNDIDITENKGFTDLLLIKIK